MRFVVALHLFGRDVDFAADLAGDELLPLDVLADLGAVALHRQPLLRQRLLQLLVVDLVALLDAVDVAVDVLVAHDDALVADLFG